MVESLQATETTGYGGSSPTNSGYSETMYEFRLIRRKWGLGIQDTVLFLNMLLSNALYLLSNAFCFKLVLATSLLSRYCNIMPAKNLYRERKEGTYAHIYNKGIENRVIFNDKEDYEAFLGFLKDYLTAPQDPESTKKSFTVNGRVFRGTPHQPKNYFNKVELIAYSLMPNHFHLLLHQKTKGSLESFIRSLCTRYSMYFNKKYKRTGSLLEGPYKSAQIKDELRMLHLTHYFHHTDGHSSYAHYLGEKADSWVNPKVVQSFFDKTKKDSLKGTDSYKNFVERYQPDQNVEKLLENMIFESESQHLERRHPASEAENQSPEVTAKFIEEIHQNRRLNPLQRIPEVMVTTIVFLLLLTFGIRNVMISAAKSSLPSSTVLSVSSEVIPTPSTTITPDFPSSSDHASLAEMLNTSTSSAVDTFNISTSSADFSTKEEVKPEMMLLTINASGSASVNIREKPTVNSKKIGEAKDGDIFEFVSADSEWYEVKLYMEPGSTGFISAKYIQIAGGNK